MSFHAGPGRLTVLRGQSGSGKSTLISVLAGDLLPSAGVLRIDGIELNAQTQAQVRGRTAVVRQRTWLFGMSVADNIRLGRPEASDSEIWEALEHVGLATWVRSLPRQLDSPVGERGAQVSGGQAQRLSLARALVAGRPIIVLDEPTAQVDRHSEEIISRVIEQLSQDHTVIMATHRALPAGAQVLNFVSGKAAQ